MKALINGLGITTVAVTMLLLGCEDWTRVEIDSSEPSAERSPAPEAPPNDTENTNDQPAKPPTAADNCRTDTPVLEPTRGEEMPLPHGLDIRFLAWSPSKRNWVFIGENDGSYSIDGNRITGYCFDHPDGGRYHYIGYRTPSSNSPLIEEPTGTYRKTYRLYYKKYAK